MADSPGQTTSLSSKRQKASLKACRSSCDKISSLPDDLIHRILSLLSTKEAVKTSVLSKRWVWLWTLVSTLDLEESFRCRSSEQAQMKFVHFVYRVLLLNKAGSFEKFRLKCSQICDDHSCFKTWICSAIQRGLQEMDISISVSEQGNRDLVRIPRGLFLMKALKILKLHGEIMVDVPVSVCLPRLKILHLLEVKYANVESISCFISGCLSLEELRITASISPINVVNFNISSPTLNNLILELGSIDGLPEPRGIKVDINAPALKHFNFYSFIREPHQYFVESFPCLIEANVFFPYMSGIQLFRAFNAVKRLKLVGPLTPLKWAGNAVPLFPDLTQLEFTYRNWFVLLLFLRKSPKLETLVVHNQIFTRDGLPVRDSRWRQPKKVPKCFLSSLTSARFEVFHSLEDELKMIEYFLKNAKVLRTLEIYTSCGLSSDSKHCLLEKLSMFPRSSRTCQLSFN